MTGSFAIDSAPRWFEHLSSVKMPSLRLFCFPYAGGSADVYRNWQRWFPEEFDICLVHLPGRGTSLGERGFTRIIPLVKAIADRIDSETSAPYALYGHSMGALICFELARELFCRHGSGPQHLFVSGRNAPSGP
jgi:medium-chain acyl-[acyl-carrier-protein] hydrolase